MKICLLTCKASFLIDEKVFPPLGLMAVGTALRLQGHEVVIKSSPDNSQLFALGPTTPEYTDALRMLHQIKLLRRPSRVIIGGPHAAANAEECLDDGFDAVALGDGENITSDTFSASGIVDLGSSRLDEYPITDRSLVDICSYHYKIKEQPATTLVTSRGCPYQCGFCAKVEGKLRYRSLRKIEDEITYLQTLWGYNALMIFDDTYIVDAKRVQGICSTLKPRGIVWRCFARGDLVVRHGQDLIDTMADSGCVEVAIGIESGSSKILQTINKGESIGTIWTAIRMLHHARIRVKGLFIVGLPGENRESLLATREFIEEVPLDDADFTIYQPYRGSPIWNNRHDYDISWNDAPVGERFYKGRGGEYKCSVRTSALTSEEIVEARDELERFFKCRR